MHDNFKPTALTIALYATFAVWLASNRYQPPSFYRLAVGQWLEIALILAVLLSVAGTLAAIMIRAFRLKVFPAVHLIAFTGAVISAELVWRFWISRGPPDFKLIGAFLDIATPLVAALGIWAFITEYRRQGMAPAHSNSTMT